MKTNWMNPMLAPADEDAVNAAIATIREKLPFLVDLSTPERRALAKVGDKARGFVRKALDVAVQNPGILPAAVALDNVRNVTQLYESLEGIRLSLDQLQKQVEDTVMQVGSEAYATARSIYRCTRSGFAGMALQTAADDLGRHFVKKVSKPAPVESQSDANGPPESSPAPAA